jgi:hypothetical protein
MDSNHDKVDPESLVSCWPADDDRKRANFRPVRPEDDKRSASDDQQVTKRSAESVPPEPRGLRGRGGERPFSDCESARSAAHMRFGDDSWTFTTANQRGST